MRDPQSPAAPPPVARRLFWGWAFGAFCTGVLANSVGLLHMRFMTDSLGIAAGTAGMLVALSKIYDAVFDPIMGGVSDRTRSAWGPRRPYLLAGAGLCAASMVLLFLVPQVTGRTLVLYMGFTLLFFSTAYTMFRIPYLAMAPDLTQSFEQRSRLMNWNVMGSSIGSLAATSAAPFLLAHLGSDRRGHEITAALLAVLILVSGLACFAATRGAALNPPPAPPHKRGARVYLAALAGNRPFLALIAFKLTAFVALTLHAVSVPYYTRHALKVSDNWLGGLFLAQTIMTMVSQPLWRRIARRHGRRATARIASAVLTVAYLSWLAPLVMDAKVALILIGVINGIGGGGLFFSIQTMLPDTIEYDRRRNGLAREGVFAGLFVMTEKITTALAVSIFGLAVGLLGYQSSSDAATVQPLSAIMGIYALAALAPVALMLVAMAILQTYTLDEATLDAARRADAETRP